MKTLLAFLLSAICISGKDPKIIEPPKAAPAITALTPKIQVAILLDVSNSMDGLIDQAKSQLWNMVNTVGKAKCSQGNPQLEIALYEYGRSSNHPAQGYIKQIRPFTSNLDQLSEDLFNLKTEGGDEYCTNVIVSSLQELQWDSGTTHYKVIFIAGNEDFQQGSIPWATACHQAKNKGVIVNTIYCGSRMDGMREHWNLGTECGMGSFTNINQDARIQDISTPYDDDLFVLNERLNNTYMAYGAAGAIAASKQKQMDQANKEAGALVFAKRIAVKGNNKLYKNNQWDLVDAITSDSTSLQKIPTADLPTELQGKSKTEVHRIVQQKSTERANIQHEIARINQQRADYIADAKRKGPQPTEATLETEVEKILKEQLKRFNMVVE